MRTEPSSKGRRFGRAILWILKTSLITFVLLAIIAGILYGGFVGVTELQRSFNNVSARLSALEQNQSLLRSDVDNLRQDPSIEALEDAVASLETRLNDLSAQVEQRQRLLSTLEDDVSGVTEASNELAEDVAALNAALLALQSDITSNSSSIDALGGEIDDLQTRLSALDADLSALVAWGSEQIALATAEAERGASELQKSLALFRVWELIARARLRLLENNAGLAANDVETALRTLDALITAVPQEDVPGLQLVRSRLLLAQNNLPANPTRAALDLEMAWDELDAIFAAQILADLEAEAAEIDEEVETAETDAATATGTPTTTPLATPTPTGTPSP